jgi:hypothetical protein
MHRDVLTIDDDHLGLDNAPARRSAAWSPNAQWGDWFVEIIASHSLRDVRSRFVEMAYFLEQTENTGARAMCVLVDSKVSANRIDTELNSFRSILRPDLASRLHAGRLFRGKLIGLNEPDPAFVVWLKDLARHKYEQSSAPGATQQKVFAHLVRAWLKGAPPKTTAAIQSVVGASYPTVAAVLKSLQAKGVLARSRDRRVGLRIFPWDEWRRSVVTVTDTRKPARFVDTTGYPRDPEDMVRRLMELGRTDVAISGILGAKHYYPDLDITGSLRLDLAMPGNEKSANIEFVRKLDPALKRTDDANANAVVVVQFLGPGADHAFENDGQATWADPVECLYALHELRLDAQADEMLRALIDNRPSPDGEG